MNNPNIVIVTKNIGDSSCETFGNVGCIINIVKILDENDIVSYKLIDKKYHSWYFNVSKHTTIDRELRNIFPKNNPYDTHFSTIRMKSFIFNGVKSSRGIGDNLLGYIEKNVELEGNPIITYNEVILESSNSFNSLLKIRDNDNIIISYDNMLGDIDIEAIVNKVD